MPTTILICGSPADGFQIVGLFADSGDAESYAEDHSLRDWWIAELTSPEAFADSQRRRFRASRALLSLNSQNSTCRPHVEAHIASYPGPFINRRHQSHRLAALGRGGRAGRRKKPRRFRAGASWQSGSKLEFGASALHRVEPNASWSLCPPPWVLFICAKDLLRMATVRVPRSSAEPAIHFSATTSPRSCCRRRRQRRNYRACERWRRHHLHQAGIRIRHRAGGQKLAGRVIFITDIHALG